MILATKGGRSAQNVTCSRNQFAALINSTEGFCNLPQLRRVGQICRSSARLVTGGQVQRVLAQIWCLFAGFIYLLFFFFLRCCIFNKPLIDEDLMRAVTNSLFLPAHMHHHAFSFSPALLWEDIDFKSVRGRCNCVLGILCWFVGLH